MSTDYKAELEILGRNAQIASRKLAALSTVRKNKALEEMSEAILAKREQIKAANAVDLEAGRQSGLSSAMIVHSEPVELEMSKHLPIRKILFLPELQWSRIVCLVQQGYVMDQ